MSVAAIFVYMTFPDRASAEKIAKGLVEHRLAACANLLDGMESIYRWKGAIQSDREVVLIAKTLKSEFESLREYVEKNHPYDCPCIIGLPIQQGNAAYLHWISNSLSDREA